MKLFCIFLLLSLVSKTRDVDAARAGGQHEADTAHAAYEPSPARIPRSVSEFTSQKPRSQNPVSSQKLKSWNASRLRPATELVKTVEYTNETTDRVRRVARQAGRSFPPVRARSVTKPSSPEHPESKTAAAKRLVGPHVCGGQQCCSGWAIAPGTNRCIKPDCQPPCQNRGSCSRPHTCVCRSGFQGARCEEVAPEQVYIRTGTSRVLTPIRPGSESTQQQAVRKRPTERQAIDTDTRTQTPKPAITRLPHPATTQVRRGSPDISPQQTGTSRTVKRYPSSTGPITSNALPNGHGKANGHNSHRDSLSPYLSHSGGQLDESYSNTVSPAGANLTANLDRIKIVFTPMVCRRVCNGGRCYNSCERGEKTTVYSENQSTPPKSQAYRLFFCQIPCLNGGRCIGQNECWCPSNSTGKFCHLLAPTSSKPTTSRKANHHNNNNKEQNGSSHTMYTLPLSNQQASMHPSLVNVHIDHPPEADVQVHQVARVKPGQSVDGAHSVQQRSQPANGHANSNGNRQYGGNSNSQNNGQRYQRPHNRLDGYVGRCFQETVDGQCGKPLPGLTKQEDCCGSVGASWGLNKCTECPRKPAYAVIANGQVECPKGYKRMNSTHCQDINECLMPGICKHAVCLNTKGSYRCTCKPGYMLDPARSHCVSDKAVSMDKDSCYRSVSAGSCGLPLSLKITKQICCCSRVGKAWGPACERCPLPNTDHFKEICPAGHGYTYSRSDIQITLRELEEEELRGVESVLPQVPVHPQHPPTLPETPHKEHHIPGSPQTPYPQAPTLPQPPRTAQIPHYSHHPPPDSHGTSSLPDDVETVPFFTESPPSFAVEVEEVTAQSPTHLKPEIKNEQATSTNVVPQVTDIDKCSLTPAICGEGQCVSLQTGYTCNCNPGYKLNVLQTTCIDVNECESDPCGGKGHCVNTLGSYICQCFSGYSLLMTQNRKTCQDINECAMPNKCPNGLCINTEGSYSCDCKSGFTKNWRGQCEDVDECRSPSVCPNGKCVNTQGSFQCQACSPGFRPASGRCLDINECQTSGVCANGRCVNTEGSFTCTCNHGYQTSPHNNSCQDVNECFLPDVCAHGTCVNFPGSHRCNCNSGYQSSNNGKACEDVDECTQASLCVGGVCVNTVGSFTCTLCEAGYTLSQDRQRCEDIDECLSLSACPTGICLNSEGSFSCKDCPAGYTVSADGELCDDIDECASPTACPKGKCTNTPGSYTCTVCGPGYRPSDDGKDCEDIDECSLPDVCPLAACTNTEGSYSCMTCDTGYRLSLDRRTCEDINECEDMSACLNGECINTAGSYHCDCPRGYELMDTTCRDINECLSMDICGVGSCQNTEGSFHCFCPPGYDQGHSGVGCQDVDECSEEGICSNGQCLNTDGSYRCICESGFRFSTDSRNCEDLDECKEYSDVCGTWNCENTLGSYRCFMGCQSGIYGEDNKDCDIDECEDENICGKHGYCENTDGSYRCQCDQGYTNPSEGQGCIDINECKVSPELCGGAQCENVEGSFLCLCPSENEEFDTVTFKCILRQTDPLDPPRLDLPAPLPAGYDEGQRKECYYNLNDANLCENVLSHNVTKQECCCTVGAGWGDNCEVHPCPLQGHDANECEMFGSEICKNGHCTNIDASFSCSCHKGYKYDKIRLECVDYNECAEENKCEHGTCVNTVGSFNCFCSPPLILDDTQHRCVSLNTTDGDHELEKDDIHLDICWQQLEYNDMCSSPMHDLWTTYTECCCLYGVAWGAQCAFCPEKSSGDYASLCNLPRGNSGSLRENPGFSYDPQNSWNYGLLGGDTYYGPADPSSGSIFPSPSNDYDSREPVRLPVHRPREGRPPHRVDPYGGDNEGFEGLRAEECGVLNGCENGRCVRVREGYTCDCFDGYELDLSKMACIDINECEDISDKVELCKNGVCSNTDGSYSCTCLPGYLSSSKPHECIPQEPASVPQEAGK